MVGLELEGGQIDVGIFPDLIIHKPLKHKGKKAFQGPAPGGGRLLVGGLF